MEPEWLTKLRSKRERLMLWLDRFRQAADIAPIVKMNLDFTEWEIAAIDSRPEDAYEVGLPDLSITMDSDMAHLDSALPEMPMYDPHQLLSASAFTSSGTTVVLRYVGRVGDIPTPAAKQYSTAHTIAYYELQKAYDRPNAVRELIRQVCSQATLLRFDNAARVYSQVKTGTASRRAAAIDMRNLIDGLQGDLFNHARKTPKENMTWRAMAQRISKGGASGPQCVELTAQESLRANLVQRLSEVAKDRECGSLTDLDLLWSEVLDHIHTSLGLVASA